MPLRRRHLLAVTLSPLPAMALPPSLSDELAALERRHGGRLGVALLDTRSGATLAHRGDERFGPGSTFKLSLAAAVLHRVDRGGWTLQDWLPMSRADLVSHAPLTEPQMARGGMRLQALLEALLLQSDNVAANLLLRRLGGPQALTAWLRDTGDATTRIDRYEPEAVVVLPGDERDTATPSDMAASVGRFLGSTLLSRPSRDLLTAWLRDTRIGAKRLRAGLPAAWKPGDRTGSGFAAGMPDRVNDIAVFWPHGDRVPCVAVAYYEGPHSDSEDLHPEDEAVLAEVGRIAARWVRTLK
jgi:beta-lactamase class A